MEESRAAIPPFTRAFWKCFDGFADEIGRRRLAEERAALSGWAWEATEGGGNEGDDEFLGEIVQEAWDIAFEAGKREAELEHAACATLEVGGMGG